MSFPAILSYFTATFTVQPLPGMAKEARQVEAFNQTHDEHLVAFAVNKVRPQALHLCRFIFRGKPLPADLMISFYESVLTFLEKILTDREWFGTVSTSTTPTYFSDLALAYTLSDAF